MQKGRPLSNLVSDYSHVAGLSALVVPRFSFVAGRRGIPPLEVTVWRRLSFRMAVGIAVGLRPKTFGRQPGLAFAHHDHRSWIGQRINGPVEDDFKLVSRLNETVQVGSRHRRVREHRRQVAADLVEVGGKLVLVLGGIGDQGKGEIPGEA